jgi:hypothetical protein
LNACEDAVGSGKGFDLIFCSLIINPGLRASFDQLPQATHANNRSVEMYHIKHTVFWTAAELPPQEE